MKIMIRAHVVYHGKVQGVFFRDNCERNAIELGLKGTVKNLNDGSVEEFVEGFRQIILEHIDWNRTRQPFAKVTAVDIEWEPSHQGFIDFRIIR